MAGNVYFEMATTRKNAIDQLMQKINTYCYIVDDLKIKHETTN